MADKIYLNGELMEYALRYLFNFKNKKGKSQAVIESVLDSGCVFSMWIKINCKKTKSLMEQIDSSLEIAEKLIKAHGYNPEIKNNVCGKKGRFSISFTRC